MHALYDSKTIILDSYDDEALTDEQWDWANLIIVEYNDFALVLKNNNGNIGRFNKLKQYVLDT